MDEPTYGGPEVESMFHFQFTPEEAGTLLLALKLHRGAEPGDQSDVEFFETDAELTLPDHEFESLTSRLRDGLSTCDPQTPDVGRLRLSLSAKELSSTIIALRYWKVAPGEAFEMSEVGRGLTLEDAAVDTLVDRLHHAYTGGRRP